MQCNQITRQGQKFHGKKKQKKTQDLENEQRSTEIKLIQLKKTKRLFETEAVGIETCFLFLLSPNVDKRLGKGK